MTPSSEAKLRALPTQPSRHRSYHCFGSVSGVRSLPGSATCSVQSPRPLAGAVVSLEQLGRNECTDYVLGTVGDSCNISHILQQTTDEVSRAQYCGASFCVYARYNMDGGSRPVVGFDLHSF